jgi:hypothetical protein
MRSTPGNATAATALGSESLKDANRAGISQQEEDNTSSLIEDVNPGNYSSNPPKAAYEKEIIALANRADLPDLEKAKSLLARVGWLPPQGKTLAMEHATQLIPDASYAQMRPWLFQLATSSELRETLLTDVLSRSESVRMPTLVEMLRQPPNEAQQEVREILVAYLDQDAGEDVTKWDAAVKKFLFENPDE